MNLYSRNIKNEIKYHLAAILRKVPFSYKLFSLPTKRILLTDTDIYFDNQKESKEFYKKFNSGEIDLVPATYINKPSGYFSHITPYICDSYLISLLKGKYCHIHISVITKEGFQLAIASNHPNVLQKDHPIFQKLYLPKLRIYPGLGVLLSTPNDNNYFHCLFQIAPKIWFLKENGYDLKNINLFFLEVSESKFQNEILEILEIDSNKIINLKKEKYIEVEQMLVTPTFTRPEPWICLKLRNIFLSDEKSNNHERIYISRNKAKVRRILQEKKLIALLYKFGFKVISTDGLKITEQAKIFNNSKIVIAAHGAGLANLVFCEPGTEILELRAENHQDYLGTVYEHLSSICKLSHYTYVCQEVKNKRDHKPKFSDLIIDFEFLENFIRNIIGEKIVKFDSAE